MVKLLFSERSSCVLHQRSQHDRGRSRDGERARRRLFCRGLSLANRDWRTGWATSAVLAALISGVALSGTTRGQTTIADSEPNGVGSGLSAERVSAERDSEAQARATVQSLVDFAIRTSPRHYDGQKNWESTKKVWSGIKFKRDGLRVSTNRRWREVRHGLQTRYQVRLPGAEAAPSPVRANVRSVTQFTGSDTQPAGWEIACDLATPLDFTARIERWNLGVRLYSIEVSGHMTIRMDLNGRLASYPDYSVLPPAIVIDPNVTSASLHLDALHLDRISKIGGEVAETWGEVIEKIIEYGKELLEKPIELLDGVEETLQALHGKYKLVVATKGDLLDQRRKLHNSGLGKYFHHIEVMSDKQEKDYSDLIKRLEILPNEFFMIGNSIKSDVLPVLAIGGHAVHIPFHTTWAHERIDYEVEHENFYTFDKMIEVLNKLQ